MCQKSCLSANHPLCFRYATSSYQHSAQPPSAPPQRAGQLLLHAEHNESPDKRFRHVLVRYSRMQYSSSGHSDLVTTTQKAQPSLIHTHQLQPQ